MRIAFLERFQREFAKLPPDRKLAFLEVILRLPKAMPQAQAHAGIGLRKLHQSGIWEARVGLTDRLVFTTSQDEIVLITFGSHDEVKRFLRNL